MTSLARARLLCLAAYLVALATAALVLRQLPQAWVAHPFWRIVVADACATFAVFAFSARFDNSSFYDAYWSVAPIAMSAWWVVTAGAQNHPRSLLVLVLVTVWGARLTYNWARHWGGLGHEDWRYVDLRQRVGRAYWLVSLVGLHLFPTALVLAASHGIYVASTSAAPLHWLDAVGAAVTLGAIAIEGIADEQLHAFRHKNVDPSRILDQGLWRYSRHPNYFGETTFWWGLAVIGLAAAHADLRRWWPTALGPAAITAMFLFISIPMIDTRMLSRRPHYKHRMKHVSRLIPWPPG